MMHMHIVGTFCCYCQLSHAIYAWCAYDIQMNRLFTDAIAKPNCCSLYTTFRLQKPIISLNNFSFILWFASQFLLKAKKKKLVNNVAYSTKEKIHSVLIFSKKLSFVFNHFFAHFQNLFKANSQIIISRRLHFVQISSNYLIYFRCLITFSKFYFFSLISKQIYLSFILLFFLLFWFYFPVVKFEIITVTCSLYAFKCKRQLSAAISNANAYERRHHCKREDINTTVIAIIT